jgi:hypothetical protein
MRLLKYVRNCEQHFSHSDPDYSTSRLIVTGLVRFCCTFRQNKLKRVKFIRKILHFPLIPSSTSFYLLQANREREREKELFLLRKNTADSFVTYYTTYAQETSDGSLLLWLKISELWLILTEYFSIFFYFEKKRKKAYEITLLSVCHFLCASQPNFLGSLWDHFAVCVSANHLLYSFSMLSVSYRRQEGHYLFPELLVFLEEDN